MADVRKKAEKVHGLKDDWMQAVHPIVDILEDRMKRLSLKDEPFTYYCIPLKAAPCLNCTH
jgi:hypothetical protein